MDKDPHPGSWWHSVPGILTAITGLITATAGLIIALNQVGILGSVREAPPPADSVAAPVPLGTPAHTPPSSLPEEPTGSEDALVQHAAAPNRVTLGDATFVVLGAVSHSRSDRTRTLRIRMRLLNASSYSVNFWDDSFRLLVGGVPRAPVAELNEVVQGRSAGEGNVVFVIPEAPTPLVLRVTLGGETADIRLRQGSRGD